MYYMKNYFLMSSWNTAPITFIGWLYCDVREGGTIAALSSIEKGQNKNILGTDQTFML